MKIGVEAQLSAEAKLQGNEAVCGNEEAKHKVQGKGGSDRSGYTGNQAHV